MSEIVIIGPDGNRFVFPAGTDRETMRAAMRRRYTGANARTREMIMTSQLPDPELQGVRDYLGREQLTEDVRAGREAAELEAATGPENIAKERFYTAAQGQTLGAAPLLQGAVNVPIAAVMYPFLTAEEKAGRDFGQFVSEMSSLGYDQARGNIARAREKRPLESAGIELGAGFLTGKTVYDELGKRFLASRTGARGAAVGAGAGGQYGFLEGEGDVGQGLEGALMGAPLGAGLAKTFEAAAEPIGQMFANRSVTLSGASAALPQAIVGGAGGSALGSRTDLNGDGVIDEQDVFLGSAMGTVGVPAAMALMRRGGNAFASDVSAQGLKGGGLRYGSDPTKTQNIFRDVTGKPFNADPDATRKLSRMQNNGNYIDVKLPTNKLNATQAEVHPGYAENTSNRYLEGAGGVEAPAVVKYKGQYYVTDGHHRITTAAMRDGSDVRVRLYDLDGDTDLTTPLLDFNAERHAKETARRKKETDEIYALLFGEADTTPTQTMGFGASTPKTPQQAARFETPGSPEYEAAIAKGLDMSTPARMARAKEMGFDTDTVLYHGSPAGAKIKSFDLASPSRTDAGWLGSGVYVTPKEFIAKSYSQPIKGKSADSAVLPLFVRSGKFKEFPYTSTDEYQAAIKSFAKELGVREQYGTKEWAEAFNKAMQHNGFVGAKGIGGDGQVVEVVIFDPANIRSVNAAFDPDKAASSTLLAAAPFAVGGAGLGVAANQEDR